MLEVDHYAIAVSDDDGLALGADWHPWDTCKWRDHANTALSSALATTGNCGESCALANVVTASDNDFTLDAPNLHIRTGSPVGVRVSIPFSDAVTGVNAVTVANGTNGRAPQLVVRACPGWIAVSTPAPTQTPDCEQQVIAATPGI